MRDGPADVRRWCCGFLPMAQVDRPRAPQVDNNPDDLGAGLAKPKRSQTRNQSVELRLRQQADNGLRAPGQTRLHFAGNLYGGYADQQFEYLRDWQNKVYEAGYVGMAWPKEFGGGGVDQVFQDIATKVGNGIGCRFCEYDWLELGGTVNPQRIWVPRPRSKNT